MYFWILYPESGPPPTIIQTKLLSRWLMTDELLSFSVWMLGVEKIDIALLNVRNTDKKKKNIAT